MRNSIKKKSIEMILKNQHTTGSYVACPNFENYRYCWLRDGSFIAHSMDICGENTSSRRFFDWVDRVVSGQYERVRDIINMSNNGEPLLNSDFLPTRYTLEGNEVEDEWPNFQLDGYGTWLWALSKHIKITGNNELIAKYEKSIKTTTDYLIHLYNVPNFDCWEENGDKIHTSTLSCIYGGLNSIYYYIDDSSLKDTASKIKEYVLEKCIVQGRLCKYVGSDSVDASLLWACFPFKMFDENDKIMENTASEIERKLLHNGGVHRYTEDTYYGGGEWLILSCWLGWYYAVKGEKEKALPLLEWVEKHAYENGEMPEQILDHVNNPLFVDEWKSLWGDVACPLLWSHAMYLILLEKMFNS